MSPAIQKVLKPYPRLTMGDDQQNWRKDVAHFLAGNLPKASDRPGWNDMASTAYQIGCMALIKLGFADATDWGAVPKDVPELPTIMPRWDDICISVLWLAEQQNKLSFRLPDGSLPPTRIGSGFVIAMKDPPHLRPQTLKLVLDWAAHFVMMTFYNCFSNLALSRTAPGRNRRSSFCGELRLRIGP